MAVRGDFSWPSLGNCGVRPWGIRLAVCGEFAVAVDNVKPLPRGSGVKTADKTFMSQSLSEGMLL